MLFSWKDHPCLGSLSFFGSHVFASCVALFHFMPFPQPSNHCTSGCCTLNLRCANTFTVDVWLAFRHLSQVRLTGRKLCTPIRRSCQRCAVANLAVCWEVWLIAGINASFVSRPWFQRLLGYISCITCCLRASACWLFWPFTNLLLLQKAGEELRLTDFFGQVLPPPTNRRSAAWNG